MIEVERLTKVFPIAGGREVVAVRELSFRVDAGEVYGLLGPNGAGKTSTLRMLLGLLPPTSGAARVGGHDAATHPREVKARVGMVSANTGTYSWLTGRETLEYFADLYHVPRAVARARVEELGDLFGLGEFLDRRCSGLSTGQRQRLNLARALMHDPPALLLDEPTLGLDILGRQVVAEFVQLARKRGAAVILCTHHLEEAERLCTRFGLLNRGSLAREGSLGELRAATGRESLVEMFLDLTGVVSALAGDRGSASDSTFVSDPDPDPDDRPPAATRVEAQSGGDAA